MGTVRDVAAEYVQCLRNDGGLENSSSINR